MLGTSSSNCVFVAFNCHLSYFQKPSFGTTMAMQILQVFCAGFLIFLCTFMIDCISEEVFVYIYTRTLNA